MLGGKLCVDVRGMAAEGCGRPRRAHRSHRQTEVLIHEGSGETGLEIVVGRRRGDRSGDGAVHLHGPAVAGRAGDHVEQRLLVQAEVSARTNASPIAICWTASTMLLHTLAAWSPPSRRVADRSCRPWARAPRGRVRRPRAQAADHERQRAAVAPFTPPDTGASSWAQPCSPARRCTSWARRPESADESMNKAGGRGGQDRRRSSSSPDRRWAAW